MGIGKGKFITHRHTPDRNIVELATGPGTFRTGCTQNLSGGAGGRGGTGTPMVAKYSYETQFNLFSLHFISRHPITSKDKLSVHFIRANNHLWKEGYRNHINVKKV